MNTSTACPSCGAARSPGAERCDLCGTPFNEGVGSDGSEMDSSPPASPVPLAATRPAPAVGPVDCGVCGHLNPAGSRFCNRCGATLGAAQAAAELRRREEGAPVGAEPPAPHEAPGGPAAVPVEVVPVGGDPAAAVTVERPPSDPGRRALLYVGLALAVVLGLYLLTQASRRSEPEATAASAEQPRLTAAPAALPDSLSEQVARLEDEGTATSLDQAGGLLYRAAAVLPPEDPQRAALAQQAVDLYDRSLALEEDADVRVNLAVAALLDPRNPMRAVEELQAVLNTSPDHVEANFNMGLMRMQIGRLDAAAASFERVIALTPPDDPVHRRATEALAAVEGAMAQQGTGG